MADVERAKYQTLNYFKVQAGIENSRVALGGPSEMPRNSVEKILSILNSNQEIADRLSSPEFITILEEENKLKGKTKVGVIDCIDGRISLLHQFGRSVNSLEVAGSLVDYTFEKDHHSEHFLTPNPIIDSRRFIGTLEDLASSNEGRQLLEIVTAHTGKEHKCGKITQMVKDNMFQGNIDDVALEQADIRRSAVDNTYNRLLERNRKEPQAQVAITAMIDTDHQGFILNYGQENQLSTTDILLRDGLVKKIRDGLYAEVDDFGSMSTNFTENSKFIEYSTKVLKITQYLLSTEIEDQASHMRVISEYIDTNFPNLSKGQDSQKQALMFVIARTLASQYVTGLASDEQGNHPFKEHHERYVSIAADKPFGRFDLHQSFGSTPRDRVDAHRHLSTKLSIIDSHRQQGEDTDIVFISTAVGNETWLNASNHDKRKLEDGAIAYYKNLIEHAEFSKRVVDGNLAFVPVIIDEQTGKVIEIRDYSSFIT